REHLHKSLAGTRSRPTRKMSPNPPLAARIGGSCLLALASQQAGGRASPSVNAAASPHGSCGVQRTRRCIPPEQRRDSLSSCRVFVSSSVHPGLPIPLEAPACCTRLHAALDALPSAAFPAGAFKGVAGRIGPTMAQLD